MKLYYFLSRNAIMANHPDLGGSAYLSQTLTEVKEELEVEIEEGGENVFIEEWTRLHGTEEEEKPWEYKEEVQEEEVSTLDSILIRLGLKEPPPPLYVQKRQAALKKKAEEEAAEERRAKQQAQAQAASSNQ
jgi:hypothetical protein